MSPLNTLTSLFLFSSALLSHTASAGPVTQADITGFGHIYVIQGDDWRTATPSQTIGCLSNSGRFVAAKKPKNDNVATAEAADKECGVFHKLTDYPYTISSKEGNCTFTDETKEKNKDSTYGGRDNAWTCDPGYVADIYDVLYTLVSLPNPPNPWLSLTSPRTDSITHSFAGATLPASTTLKRHPEKARNCRFGNTVGEANNAVSRLDIFRLCGCGRRWANRLVRPMQSPFLDRGLRLKRGFRLRSEEQQVRHKK